MSPVLLVLVLLTQTKPGPMDGFLANYASIKVEMDFDYHEGTSDGRLVTEGILWETRNPLFSEDHSRQIIGRWACDGSTEYYDFSSPEDVIEAGKKQPPAVGQRVPYVPRVESIYNGKTRAAHVINDEVTRSRGFVVNVFQDGEPGLISLGKGPFLWWIQYPFPRFLQVHFQGLAPRRTAGTCAGRPVEIEVYRRSMSKGWIQMEVFYDPSIGYLPRFLRSVSSVPGGNTFLREIYLTEAQPCASGGFVPMEWFSLDYALQDFESKYPDYSPGTVLIPASGVGIGHFKGSHLRSKTTPVALKHLTGVHTISGPGGRIPVRTGTSELGLTTLTTALGPKLTNPASPALPHLDRAEIEEFRPRSTRYHTLLLASGLAITTLSLLFWARRKHRRSVLGLLSLCLISIAGCERASEPIVKMTGEITPDRFLCDLNEQDFDLTLTVKNAGNQTLHLFGASAGCSCRQVEQSRFPIDLRPGSSIGIPVRVSNSRQSTPQNLLFSFETNHGTVGVPVSLYQLPRHQVSPASIGCGIIDENEDWTLQLVHRAIAPANASMDNSELSAPEEFETKKIARDGGAIAAAPEFQYLDTTYQLKLRDRRLGMHKALLQVVSRGARVAEIPVVWNRVAFLSSAPDRIILGTRPVRVFLRCPDETVEFDRITRTPPGIKAVVSSVRELTVMPTSGTPPILDDFVEVQTTARNRPPLRIPIVRYAPSSPPMSESRS
jgi:hypothetical protein